MPLSTVKSDNTVLSEKVAEQVVRYIQENRLRCGDRLPNEREMEALMGVSRSTVREAMHSLRSRGIVEIRQGSGTYVAEAMGISDDPLGLAFRYDHVRTLADLLELRFMFEPAMASACAYRADDKQKREIYNLSDVVTNLIRHGEDHTEKDIELHCTIARAADNELVNVIFPGIQRAILLYMSILKDSMLQETIRGHEEIVNAIMRSDTVGASRGMLRHLESNRVSIMNSLSVEHPREYRKEAFRFERLSTYASAGNISTLGSAVFTGRAKAKTD